MLSEKVSTMVYLKHAYNQVLNGNPVINFLKSKEENIEIDLSDIKGTYAISSYENINEISKRIKNEKEELVYILGSGNFHYLNLALSKDINKPFNLFVFDHHVDAYPFYEDHVSCGSWIDDLIKNNPNLKHVFILACSKEQTEYDFNHKDMFSFLIDRDYSLELLKSYLNKLSLKDAYISIDCDVFAESVLMTNWDQGIIDLETALKSISLIKANTKLIKADICGGLEWDFHNFQAINNKKYFRQEINVYQALLTALEA